MTTVERLRANGINLEVSEKVIAEIDGNRDYEQEREEELKEARELAEFYRKHIADADRDSEEYRHNWSYYSDWHKDVYGYRPRF